jgi:hypothetical protein
MYCYCYCYVILYYRREPNFKNICFLNFSKCYLQYFRVEISGTDIFFCGARANSGLGRLIVEVSRSHTPGRTPLNE